MKISEVSGHYIYCAAVPDCIHRSIQNEFYRFLNTVLQSTEVCTDYDWIEVEYES